jgi:hypothetical protein
MFEVFVSVESFDDSDMNSEMFCLLEVFTFFPSEDGLGLVP